MIFFAREEGLKCITQHSDFEVVFMNEAVLRTSWVQLRESNGFVNRQFVTRNGKKLNFYAIIELNEACKNMYPSLIVFHYYISHVSDFRTSMRINEEKFFCVS